MIDIGLYITYALIGASIFAILTFALLKVFSNVAAAKNILIGIIALIVLVIISYALNDGSDAAVYKDISENTLKTIGAGLVALYLLAGLAIFSILYFEIIRLFK